MDQCKKVISPQKANPVVSGFWILGFRFRALKAVDRPSALNPGTAVCTSDKQKEQIKKNELVARPAADSFGRWWGCLVWLWPSSYARSHCWPDRGLAG